ncbi:HAD family hydrolase [Arthrobacter roseus]|uniref:HAD family hydrolase n=1 Tax=Arthrobacter roseus TaxID=136274 RepID=UPI0019655974|nr:HAD family hydrolase [Arthrobacter roseus]MBM7846868.1 phosphoglycolate phosphatase [Arthrobacter roseus]
MGHEASLKSTVALFDLDGTLLDTPRAIAGQLVAAVEHVTGNRPTFETAHSLIGLPLPEICATLSGLANDPAVQAIVARYLELYRANIVPAAAGLLFPGVESGLSRLADSGIDMAVVTNKQSDSAKLILDAAGISRYFTTVVGVDETERAKPHPDPALLALNRMRTVASSAVMVGDTPTDMNMARAVPMRSIAVTYGVATEEKLRACKPAAVATTFSEVVSLVESFRWEAKPKPA